MKTQIIQLEPHDDIISIRDKIGWARASRVLLTLPKRGKVLRDKTDLAILKRHCQTLGVQVALITKDSLTCTLASEIGLPTFPSLTKANYLDWQSPTVSKPPALTPDEIHARFRQLQQIRNQLRSNNGSWFTTPLGRLVSFFLGACSVLLLAVALLPRAEIKITPQQSEQSLTLTLTASQQFKNARPTGEFPVTLLPVQVSKTKAKKVSGVMNIPIAFARGEVLLTNLTDQPIQIPKGTFVRTISNPPHRYQITTDGVLPPTSGATVLLPVQAVIPGASENVPQNSIQALEGDLGLQLSVKNPQEINGGRDQTSPAPSASDRLTLLEETQNELIRLASERVTSMLAPGDLLLSTQPSKIEITRKEFVPTDQRPADTLELSLELKAYFATVQYQHLQTVGLSLLDASLPSGSLPLNTTFKAECTHPPQRSDSSTFTCPLKISRLVKQHINIETLQKSISGKSIEWVKTYLQSAVNLQTPPEIKISPAWLPIFPILPFQIDIST